MLELFRRRGSEPARQLLLLGLALAVVIVSGAIDRLDGRAVGQIRAFERVAAFGPDGAPVDVLPADPFRLPKPAGVDVYRVDVVIPEADGSRAPLALMLSGLFAAEVAWDGAPLGANGRPGFTAAEEVPGRIDAQFPIPEALARPGVHRVEVRLSAHQARVPAGGLLHAFAVAPARPDARRPITQYAAPVIALGVLAFATITLAGPAPSPSPNRRLALGLFLALAVAAAAETSRSLINYAYPLHEVRMGLLAAAAAVAGLLLAAYAARTFGAHVARTAGFAAAAMAAIAFVEPSLNPKIAGFLAAGAVAGAAVSLRALRAGAPHAVVFAGGFAVLAGLAAFNPSQFLDQHLYAAILPLIANIGWRETTRPAPARRGDRPVPASPTLTIASRGRLRIVPFAEIRAVRAAGAGVEIELADGRRALHDGSMEELAARLTGRFFRVHRSHIVNLDRVREVKSHGGGRYSATLDDGSETPVSRARVAKLRDAVIA